MRVNMRSQHVQRRLHRSMHGTNCKPELGHCLLTRSMRTSPVGMRVVLPRQAGCRFPGAEDLPCLLGRGDVLQPQ
jgi:hypothetical protein